MFPLLYHTHHSLHTEDIPFWQKLAKQTTGDILEMGCGTGRVYLPLLRALKTTHRHIVGIDTDASMLHFLRDHTPPSLISKTFLAQADMTTFRSGVDFSLVLIPCNTYSTLTRKERLATLAHAHAHLTIGGLFVVSVPNPIALADLPAYGEPELEETSEYPINSSPVQVSSYWEKDAAYFNLYWQYDIIHPDGSVEEITTRTQHELTPLPSYLDELHKAGFTNITIYGDFDCTPFTEQSPALILLAQSEG